MNTQDWNYLAELLEKREVQYRQVIEAASFNGHDIPPDVTAAYNRVCEMQVKLENFTQEASRV